MGFSDAPYLLIPAMESLQDGKSLEINSSRGKFTYGQIELMNWLQKKQWTNVGELSCNRI